MQRFTMRQLPVLALSLAAALGLAALAPPSDVVAQRRAAQGTLNVRITTGECGTCAMPPGPPRPARNVAVRVARENRTGARSPVSEGATDSAGVARFTLRPGRYCVEAASPGAGRGFQSAIGSRAASCDDVVAGRTADMMLDVRACPELRCTGMEP